MRIELCISAVALWMSSRLLVFTEAANWICCRGSHTRNVMTRAGSTVNIREALHSCLKKMAGIIGCIQLFDKGAEQWHRG